ncbi:hypothetical protein CASFOL_008471 [Castilleja foliolosa]|uniref:NADP-dependent oxidoreductase domain-containing protein n=1 Tax=Castilleja foliolosa TaxID=1961234 RepID=A0ABD3DZ13_9LAMI
MGTKKDNGFARKEIRTAVGWKEGRMVALRWGLSKGSSVIVKSFNEERLKENMGALDLSLEANDIAEIEKMEEMKLMRGEVYVNKKTSPYKTIQDL